MDGGYPSAWFGESMTEIKPNQMLQQHDQSTITTTIPASAAAVQTPKKRRNPPATPNPDAEVVALSPRTLTATNRFICEVCNKGFQREQNLQLHRRGHNLPWKLKQRATKDAVARKKVYLCPEPTCVNHDPSRALGDLTGIKKHYFRKHGEKKWKCERCSKRYAVRSDWKAHSKICGTKEYRCACGTIFSRRDSFVTHRTFCEALATESSGRRNQTGLFNTLGNSHNLLGNNLRQQQTSPAQTVLNQFPQLQQPKPIFTQQDTSQLGFQQNPETLTSYASNPPVPNQDYLGYFLTNNNSNSSNIVDQNLGFLSPDQFSNMIFPNNVGGPNHLEQQGNNNNNNHQQISHLDEQILWSSVLGQRQGGDLGEFLKGKNVVMSGSDKKLTLDFLGVGGMMRNDVAGGGGGGGYSGRAQEQFNSSCLGIEKKTSPGM